MPRRADWNVSSLGTSVTMRENNFPEPVSDPQAEGLPETADDDSTAYDDVQSGREADGPSPAALPSDVPLAVDRFGTTAEEARLGESLDLKLARETPDVEPAPGAGPLGDGSYVEPNLESVVSLYDQPDFVPDGGGTVGRQVEPDEGAHSDQESDAIAYDAGAAGGGASAEELAMHEVREP